MTLQLVCSLFVATMVLLLSTAYSSQITAIPNLPATNRRTTSSLSSHPSLVTFARIPSKTPTASDDATEMGYLYCASARMTCFPLLFIVPYTCI